MANDTDITFTIGFDVDKAKQKEAFNKMSYSFTNFPLAKLSRSEKKELNSFLSRHNEEIANQHLKRFLNTPERGVGLLAKANKYRNEHDAISKLMGISSVPTAPAHEQYLALKQFEENNTKEQKAFKAKLYTSASSIGEAIGKAFDERVNNIKTLRENKASKDQEIELNEFANRLNGNGGRNGFEERNFQKLSLLNERRKASFDFTQAESDEERNNAIKRYTNADQQLKALKDQGKEKKNNAKEDKGSLIRFGKMLAILLAVKKVIGAIKDLWKRLSDTELKVTQRDVKEKGFFSVDAHSAMHANVDRSHAVISRGLGYMGKAAPFSMEAFDSVLQQLQDLKLKAISGQGIADEQLVISLQRLSDTLGMGFNIKDILTNPNLNLTDFLTNLMNSVEKFLPKLNSLDDIKKTLVTNDIIKALGPELANALVYNYNYNQRTGGTSTVMEQVTSKGTNVYGLIDYTEEAKKFSQALASSRAALDDFKVSLVGVFAPAAKVIADKANEVVSEGTMLLQALKTDNKGWSYRLTYSGASDIISEDKKELSDWYQENQELAARTLEGSTDFSSLDDVLNYAYYNPRALAAGTSSSSLEQTVGLWKGSLLAQKIQNKTYDQVKAEKESGTTNFSPEEWDAVEDIYRWHLKGSWKFTGNGGDVFNTKSWKKLFDEGGAWDVQKGEPAKRYAISMLGEEGYQLLIASILAEKNNFLQEAGIMKENGLSYYTPTDENGNQISGTVTFRLELTDGSYREIPTIIEDGVIKTMANAPSIQLQ